MIATRQHKAQISLYRACKNNQCDRVKAAIDNGASIEQADGTAGANKPLHIAAIFGAAHVVQQLQQFGADLKSLNAKGSTPLEVARRIGEQEVVALLEALAQGGCVHLEGHGDDDENEEVDQSAQLSLFEACRANDAGGAANAIYRGADAGVADFSAAANRPLHVAAVYGAVECIELLVATGRASLWSRNAEGLTALELARRASQPRAASLLEDLLQGRQPDGGGGPLQGGGPGPAPGQGGLGLDGTVVFGDAPLAQPGAEQQPVNVDAFAANGQPLPQFIRMRGG